MIINLADFIILGFRKNEQDINDYITPSYEPLLSKTHIDKKIILVRKQQPKIHLFQLLSVDQDQSHLLHSDYLSYSDILEIARNLFPCNQKKDKDEFIVDLQSFVDIGYRYHPFLDYPLDDNFDVILTYEKGDGFEYLLLNDKNHPDNYRIFEYGGNDSYEYYQCKSRIQSIGVTDNTWYSLEDSFRYAEKLIKRHYETC